MKRIGILIGLTFAALGFSLVACRTSERERPPEEMAAVTPVKAVEVRRQKISEKLVYTGTIEAWQKINITPDIGGKISRIYVNEGDRVERGQLLAELDTQAIRLQLQQAEAAFAVAEANFNDALKNEERMDRLLAEKAVSPQQHEKVKLAYEAADAQLKQAQAALNLARHNLEVSLMRAPFRGIVASKNAEVGDVINPMMGGFSPASGILTLMDFSRVKIKVDVTHNDIRFIKKGQAALLRLSTLPGRAFEGIVTVVNPAADPMSRKFGVEITADNPDLLLRPGTFGEVVLEIETRDNALVVPQKAVIDNRFVFLAGENKALRREVVLGLQNADLVEIVSGISEGDMVIVEGNFGLEDGAKISLIEVKK